MAAAARLSAMPVIQIDLMEGHDDEVHRALIQRCTARYAEIVGGPVERFRSTVVTFPPSRWGLGGEPGAQRVSPLIRLTLLAGRPPEMLRRLVVEVSEVCADALGIDVADVRMLITEMAGTHWGIGGVPASEARAAELAARAST